MRDAVVRAYGDAARTDTLDSVTTSETGTFSLDVPTLSGTVWLDANPVDSADISLTSSRYTSLQNAAAYVWFDHPENRPNGSIAVIPGQPLNFGTFKGNSVQPRITSVRRGRLTDQADAALNLVRGEYTDSIVVTWEYDTRSATAADGYVVADGASVDFQVGTTSVATGVTTPNAIIRGSISAANPAGISGRGQ